MEKKYIMSIDQGTSSTRAIIWDKKGTIISSSQPELMQYYPEPGWVEHDANEIWISVQSVIADALIRGAIRPEGNCGNRGNESARDNGCVWGPRYWDANPSCDRFGNPAKLRKSPTN